MAASTLNACNLAYEGHLEELISLISSKQELLNKKDNSERAPLHWACSAGKAQIVEYLIEAGANVNDGDDVGKYNTNIHDTATWLYFDNYSMSFYEAIV